MDDLNLAQYRKIMVLVLTAGIIFILQRYDMTPADLPIYGLEVGGLAEPIVDFLLQIGIPAVFTMAQPNEEGRSLWTYWRWLAVGLGGLGAAVAGVALLL